ncbi:Zn-dependent exopeptidase [Xylaria bambusicola]|uniref:Zn-dependent exopeptidase n=1 Tax=Xylaria bambusicola TaxID=326684 RepID=UPI0020082387|nr:Zn-dependent exopeptidase [Xylaria bambusicola]KAI0508455.1 Zn-dependent exopeptidase [Xylaria bambusicola]
MPSEKSRYEPAPPIPSYEEATAGDASSSRSPWPPSPSPSAADTRPDHETEAQSLLRHNRPLNPSRRAPAGYQPPHVETDDEGSDWSLEDDSDDNDAHEAAQVRREMQELEIEDPLSDSNASTSSWTKRISFSRFSLPRWKWRWRLPRMTVRLPRQSDNANNDDNDDETAESNETRTRWRFPKLALSSRDVVLLIGRLLALTAVLGTVYLLFVSDLFANMSKRLNNQMYDPEAVREFLQLKIEPEQIKESLRHFTSYAHLAGTEGDYALAMDIHNAFVKNGFDQVAVDEYYVYLNYPQKNGRLIEIMSADGKKPIWSAILEENDVGGESAGHQTYAFHGHSMPGDVKGPLIYANYGSRKDFQRLADQGIDTKGAIALVRHHGTQQSVALKVKAAEMAGFVGCIVYSDPADNGFVKGEPAPKGRFMPSDGVERGSVSLSNWVIGDVLTPGWESKEENPRMKLDQTKGLVRIPSLPIAWRDAQVLLQHIEGFGEQPPKGWRGGVPQVKWWTGNSSSPIVRLRNEQDDNEKQKIWNIYGKIDGIEQEEKSIIIGNHRDAWAFGATEPNSGTAIMLEVARVFGELAGKGWRPLRSIEFMSWDAEEYNMIGSTEFVEKNLEVLQKQAFAYINLDGAISGQDFHAAGSPMFRKLMNKVLGRVFDPVANETLYTLWQDRKADLEPLGSESDYVAFQDIAGTSSLDIRFDGKPHPRHTSYDNFQWMESIGDRDFVYHGLLGQVLALLIIELADRPVLPLDLGNYAFSLDRYYLGLWQWAEKKGISGGVNPKIMLDPIKEALNHVRKSITQFERWEPYWEQAVIAANGWEPAGLGLRRLDYNSRMAAFESDLLDLEVGGGIPNRTQFKHVIFGPQLWNEYKDPYFPAIRDVIEAQDWPLAQAIIDKTAKIIDYAATALVAV